MLRRLPLLVALPYLLATWLLFIFGPYVWPVRTWWVIYAYVPACFAVLALGFVSGINAPARSAELRSTTALYFAGASAAILLLVPTTLTYIGKLPWQILGSLQDQRGAYASLQDQLVITQGNRGPIALARALSGPFIFCVVPVAVLYWSLMSKFEKLLAVIICFIGIDMSILRGTTAPIADLVVVGSSAYLVRVALQSSDGALLALTRRWKSLLIGGIAAGLVVTTMIGRTEARMGGQNISCLADSGVCADLSSGIYGAMSNSAAFDFAAVAGYFSQRYYGVALAAEKPFLSTWGVGHSAASAALFVQLGGDENFVNRSYTSRARGDGWSDQSQWSSLITWLANDVSLWGVLPLLFLLGWLWGRSWLDASKAGDIRATVFFCGLQMIVFYLPANNYMMQSYDEYATLVFWGVIWAVGRGRRQVIL